MANTVESLGQSIATTPTSEFFSSRALLQSSVNLISAVAQQCPLRRPDMLGEKLGTTEAYG